MDRVHKFDYELYELNMETREKQMNAVKQYTFIQVEPRQDAEDAWFYVESIDRIMELVFGGLSDSHRKTWGAQPRFAGGGAMWPNLTASGESSQRGNLTTRYCN